MEDEQAEGSESPIEPELLATFTEIGIVETRRAIEAILLVATDPTPASLLAQLLEVPVEHVELLCHALADSYEEANHGFQLVKVAGGWRFQTHPDMAPYVERFAMDGQSSKLSNAALETLAIVAYKQPISRAQVSAIRGVNVDAVLRTLVQRGYVDEVGRDTGAGQAVLFGTTSMFLERLGINTVSDLPALGDFVPSAEVVEALEQTLKVNLDPDLTITDLDRDDGPARPPAQADGDPSQAATGEASTDEGPGEAATEEATTDEGPGEAAAAPAAEAEVEPEPAAEVEVEPELAAEAEAEDEAEVSEAEIEEPAVVADDEVAQPENERAGEQTEVAPDPVLAPEGVVVDAEASPKSGAYLRPLPLDPGGQPPGQAGGGQPGMAGPSSAPVADTRAGDDPGDGKPVPRSGSDPAHSSDPDADPGSGHLPGPDRPGVEPGEPVPAAGRSDHAIPTGHPSELDQAGELDQAVGSGAPPPTAGGPTADVARDTAPGGNADPQSHPRPGGQGLDRPADPPVPPSPGPGPDLTAEPVVDLRPHIDLTDPTATPADELAPDAERA